MNVHSYGSWRYLECKRAMQAISHHKIAEHNGKQLKALTEDRRNGSRRFWTYVSSYDRRAAMPRVRNEDTDLAICDLLEHLTEHMHRLYQPAQSACVSAEENEAEMHCPEDEIMKWQATRRAVDKTIARIYAHTAKVLDGIPASVVKHLGDAARDHLANIFSGIVAGNTVPRAWRTGRVCLLRNKGGDAGLLRDYRPFDCNKRPIQCLCTGIEGLDE
ncbi:hypothetical protein MRX96_037166 [Rhipicephalus microplus]